MDLHAEIIKHPKVENVLQTNTKGKVKKGEGTLFLTITHLIFADPKAAGELVVQYMTIQSVEIRNKTARGQHITIECKDFRTLDLIIADEAVALSVVDSLRAISFPTAMNQVYAFQYRPEYDAPIDGWRYANLAQEYRRLLGAANKDWVMTDINKTYELCPTYSSRLYTPAGLRSEILRGCAKFRSKGRLPSLSFVYRNGAFICRCSQPYSGVQAKRSMDDEHMLAAMHRTNPSGKQTIIVDTRPRINAMANRAGGKGFENTEGYPDCKLVFEGIQNIHVMRDSLAGLIKACRTSATVAALWGGVKDCGWLGHIRAVLHTSVCIVKYVSQGHGVLVHCSDGWDRTAQTCSLSGFMLDPYYRTLEGFAVLVEKEWLAFGHKFAQRNGLIKDKAREVSPIFLQFLEAAWHLSRQFPRAFEFNERLLLELHDCLHSCQFGTFLGNCDRERRALNVEGTTESVWSYIFHRKAEFLNPLYNIGEAAHQGVLLPDLSPQNFVVWTAMYCRWDADVQPKQDMTAALASMDREIAEDQAFLRNARDRVDELEAKISAAEEEKGGGGGKKKEML